jgi:hypothetical protein
VSRSTPPAWWWTTQPVRHGCGGAVGGADVGVAAWGGQDRVGIVGDPPAGQPHTVMHARSVSRGR